MAQDNQEQIVEITLDDLGQSLLEDAGETGNVAPATPPEGSPEAADKAIPVVVDAAKNANEVSKQGQNVVSQMPLNKPTPADPKAAIITPEASAASVAAATQAVKPIAGQPMQSKASLIAAVYEQMLKLTTEELTTTYNSMVTQAPPLAPNPTPAEQIKAGPDGVPTGEKVTPAGVQAPAAEKQPDTPPDQPAATPDKVDTSPPPAQSNPRGLPANAAPEVGPKNESLQVLLAAEKSLSENFKTQASTIFESEVQNRLKTHVSRLEENYQTQLTEEVEKVEQKLTEQVNSYLDYVVKTWTEENKVALERGLRTEIAEGFITGMQKLFKESYVAVPEGKEDLIESLNTEVAGLSEQLLKATSASVKLNEQVAQLERARILTEQSQGLAATEVAKLTSLTESVSFDDAESFGKKIAEVKNTYFKKPVSAKAEQSVLSETVLGPGETIEPLAEAAEENSDPVMARYSDAIARTVKSQKL